MRSQPVVMPSGFFALRTPLLPFTAVTARGDGLQAPAATDPDRFVRADPTKPAALSSSVVWNLHRGAGVRCGPPRPQPEQVSRPGSEPRPAGRPPVRSQPA